MASHRPSRLNAFNNTFALNVQLQCRSVLEAIQVTNLLDKYKFTLTIKRNNFGCMDKYVEQRQERLKFIMDNLRTKTNQDNILTKKAISIGKYFNFVRKHYSISTEMFAKDISFLVLQRKIIAYVEGNHTMLIC